MLTHFNSLLSGYCKKKSEVTVWCGLFVCHEETFQMERFELIVLRKESCHVDSNTYMFQLDHVRVLMWFPAQLSCKRNLAWVQNFEKWCLVNRYVEKIRFRWYAEWFQFLFSTRNIKITRIRKLLIKIAIKIIKTIFIKQFIIDLRVMMN